MDDLPKKLTVRFEFENKLVLICIRADLTGESDMRALAVQIGAQMAGDQSLKFMAPLIKQTGQGVEYDQNIGHFREYYLTIILRDIPKTLDQEVVSQMAYLRWCDPFPTVPEKVKL